MTSSNALKSIVTAARPLIEQWLDIGDQLAALRDAATMQDIEWQPVKTLLKAQILDERDGKSRVQALLERAETATAYADMLGWSGEKKLFSGAAIEHDPDTGEITEPQAARPTPPVPAQAAAESLTSSSGDEPDRKAGLAAAADNSAPAATALSVAPAAIEQGEGVGHAPPSPGPIITITHEFPPYADHIAEPGNMVAADDPGEMPAFLIRKRAAA